MLMKSSKTVFKKKDHAETVQDSNYFHSIRQGPSTAWKVIMHLRGYTATFVDFRDQNARGPTPGGHSEPIQPRKQVTWGRQSCAGAEAPTSTADADIGRTQTTKQ